MNPLAFLSKAIEFAQKHPALTESAERLVETLMQAHSPEEALSAAQRAIEVESAKRLLKID